MGFLYTFLFVAAIILLLGWNPDMEEASVVTAKDKVVVKKIYHWLRTSSFLTIPSLIFLMIYFELSSSYRYEMNYRLAAAVLPLVWHAGLFGRLRIKNLFVCRHTQQALALVVLRAGIAALALNGENVWLFLLGNGFLWFFGTWWGNRQLKRNTCWLMERKHERIIVADDAVVQDEKKTPHQPVELPSAPAVLVANAKLAQAYLDKGTHFFIDSNDKINATENLMLAFQLGAPEVRQRAVEVLDKLGEVEKF
jgi:hypothetical protein